MFMNLVCVQSRLDFIHNGNLNEHSEYTEAKNINLQLKDHQKTMLKAMQDLESGITLTSNKEFSIHTNIGICADSTGSGKSIEILAHIADNPVYTPQETICEHFSSFAYFKSQTIQSFIASNLIVVPHSCVSQWQNYISLHTRLALTIIAKRKDIIRFCEDEHVNQKGITLCSSSMYNEFTEIHRCKWTRVIFDEADSISIPAARRPLTNFTWFVTSSLQNLFFPSGNYLIQHQLPNTGRTMISRQYLDGIRRNGYIKDTFRYLEHDSANMLLKSIVLKNKDEYIKLSFKLPNPIINTIHCKAPAYIKVLDGNVSSFVMSMLNAGNIQGAIEKVGCSIDTYDNIISSVTTMYDERISNLNRELVYVNSLQYTRQTDIDSKTKKINSIKNAIQSLENKIESIQKRMAEYNDNDYVCNVCYDEFTKPTLVSCCQHIFCFECITRSLKASNSKCPLCRAKINAKDLIVIDNNHKIHNCHHNKIITKEQAVYDIISKKQGKFLIFSSHEQSFTLIENALENTSKEFSKLMGSISRVNSILNRFKNSNLDILMLNASHYGTGLNLENTTDLIFYHKMPHDMEKQVIGRAQRAGRTQPLNIYYLYHENELNT